MRQGRDLGPGRDGSDTGKGGFEAGKGDREGTDLRPGRDMRSGAIWVEQGRSRSIRLDLGRSGLGWAALGWAGLGPGIEIYAGSR